MLGSTSGNAFSPTISVPRCVEASSHVSPSITSPFQTSFKSGPYSNKFLEAELVKISWIWHCLLLGIPLKRAFSGSTNNLCSCSFSLAIHTWQWLLLIRTSFRLVQTECLGSVPLEMRRTIHGYITDVCFIPWQRCTLTITFPIFSDNHKQYVLGPELKLLAA